MKQRLWYALFTLAEQGAINRAIKISTVELARTLIISQQTASRYLIELEKTGHITKNASFQGIEIKITMKGMGEIQRVYMRLKTLLNVPSSIITIEGAVFSGLREGVYYISQKKYRRQFTKKIGFDPYPGTLNLKLPSLEIIKKKELETYQPILIKGFKGRKRLFGDVRCYPTIINDEIEGAAIMIDRTHYDDSVIEVIASVYLREKLNLKDGNKVVLKFFPREFSS